MGPYQQKVKEDKIGHVDKESDKKKTVKIFLVCCKKLFSFT